MRIIKEIESLRKKYPVGTKIKLIRMDDSQAPDPGTIGTVTGIGAIGEIHINWENGSTLNLIDDEDEFEIVEEG